MAAIRPVAPSASLMRPSRRVAGANAHSSGTRRGDQGYRVSLVDPGRGALPAPLDHRGLSVLLGLQGLKGDKGDQGPKGDNGPKGDKGDPGLPGASGLAELTYIPASGRITPCAGSCTPILVAARCIPGQTVIGGGYKAEETYP